MDWRDPDDPATAFSIVQRQDEPNDRWQAARHRVLVRCDLKCETCGAEHNRQIVKTLYTGPAWQSFVIGTPRPDNSYVTTVLVVVVPVALPWSGEDADLLALCMGCYFRREVEQARARKHAAEPRPQRALF